MANQLLRRHWTITSKHAIHWKFAIAKAVEHSGGAPDKPLEKASVELTRSSSVEPDFDGLVSGFKAILDGLVICGVIASDKVSCISQPKYFWEKSPKRQGKVRIKVEEI